MYLNTFSLLEIQYKPLKEMWQMNHMKYGRTENKMWETYNNEHNKYIEIVQCCHV